MGCEHALLVLLLQLAQSCRVAETYNNGGNLTDNGLQNEAYSKFDIGFHKGVDNGADNGMDNGFGTDNGTDNGTDHEE